MMVAVWSVLVGTIPSGRATFPNWVSILLGFFAMLFHVALTSEFAVNKTGRYDVFTELYLRCTRDNEFLIKLKEDTVLAFERGEPVQLPESDKLVEDDDSGPVKEAGRVSDAEKQEQADVEDIEKQEQAVVHTGAEKQEQAVEGGVDEALLVQEPDDEPEIEEHSGEEESGESQ